MSDINKMVNLVLETELPIRRRVEVIVIKDGKILLTIIPPYPPKVKDPYHGFPGGGIESGDSEEDTVQKESLEELGIRLTNIRKIKMPSFTLDWSTYTVYGASAAANKIDSRKQQYSGSTTIYYVADWDGYDSSLYGSDNDGLKFKYVTIDKAIMVMDQQVRTFPDPKQIPIFKYRLQALKKIKSLL